MQVILNGVQVTDIRGLVTCFHQDYDLMGQTPKKTFKEFSSCLNEEERCSLKIEILQLLEQHPGKEQKGLLNAWFRLGAQWWDSEESNLRLCLEDWVRELEQ